MFSSSKFSKENSDKKRKNLDMLIKRKTVLGIIAQSFQIIAEEVKVVSRVKFTSIRN